MLLQKNKLEFNILHIYSVGPLIPLQGCRTLLPKEVKGSTKINSSVLSTDAKISHA